MVEWQRPARPVLPLSDCLESFGSRFLVQFFVSPFQFFILVPWTLALFSIKT
jgi:hypothetical protein